MYPRVAFAAIGFVAGLCANASASAAEHDLDRTNIEPIRELVSSLSSAWEQADGQAWGAAFIDDAYFSTWFWLRLEGRDAIAEGHQFVFDELYPDSIYELRVDHVQSVSESVAIVHLSGSVIEPGARQPDSPDTHPMSVVVLTDSGWKIAAFQKTPRLDSHPGDIRTFKKNLPRTKQP